MKCWGAIGEAEIAAWQEFLLTNEAIHMRRAPTDYFTAAFVDHFEAFDTTSVVAQANAARPGDRS